MSKKDSLGDRIKSNYESRSSCKLFRRIPVIMRLDGKAFHTLTKGCNKPFDLNLKNCMNETAKYLCENIQGAKCAYTQSDEITILITDFDKLNTDAWFDYKIQKMCSISAGLASVRFTSLFGKIALFDSRVFNVPKEEVVNNFIWRQKDWERNSLQMLARAYFSHSDLNNKNRSDMHDMLHAIGVNWSELPSHWKNGTLILNTDKGWEVLQETPIFTQDRNVIEKLMIPEED